MHTLASKIAISILGSVDILCSEFTPQLSPQRRLGPVLEKLLEIIVVSIRNAQNALPACAGMT